MTRATGGRRKRFSRQLHEVHEADRRHGPRAPAARCPGCGLVMSFREEDEPHRDRLVMFAPRRHPATPTLHPTGAAPRCRYCARVIQRTRRGWRHVPWRRR